MTINTVSANEIKEKIVYALKRFPLPILFAGIYTISAIIANEISWGNEAKKTILGLTVATLVFYPLSIGIASFMQSTATGRAMKTAINSLLIILFGVLYYFWFKNLENWTQMELLKTTLLGIAGAVFVFVSPYLRRGKSMEDFWQYAARVFGRLLITIGFFALTFLGISLLLASIDYLFPIRIDGEFYLNVFYVLSGIVGQIYFLSEIPRKYDELPYHYPGILKYVIQNLFVPLIFAYLIMLYIYAGTIIFSWNWPKGGVAGWIIAFCTAGIFTYFFSHDLKETFYKYVYFFRRKLFYSIIPLTVVLFFAVGMRIENYGVTEERYFGIILGIWLLITSFYQIISKKKDLRIFPITLIIFLLIGACGPLSAFSVSKNSQIKELKSIINEDQAYTWEEEKRMSDIIRYLIRNHGVESMQSILGEKMTAEDGSNDVYGEIYKILGMQSGGNYLEQDGIYGGNRVSEEKMIQNKVDYYSSGIETKGYEKYARFFITTDFKFDKIKVDGEIVRLELRASSEGVEILFNNKKLRKIVYGDFDDLMEEENPQPKESLTFEFENEGVKGEMVIGTIYFYHEKFVSADGVLLFTEK